MSRSLYHSLPETLETQHAREASELQSEVTAAHTAEPEFLFVLVPSLKLCLFQLKYREPLKKSLASSLFHLLPETLETAHARDVSDLLSEVTAADEHILLLWI